MGATASMSLMHKIKYLCHFCIVKNLKQHVPFYTRLLYRGHHGVHRFNALRQDTGVQDHDHVTLGTKPNVGGFTGSTDTGGRKGIRQSSMLVKDFIFKFDEIHLRWNGGLRRRRRRRTAATAVAAATFVFLFSFFPTFFPTAVLAFGFLHITFGKHDQIFVRFFLIVCRGPSQIVHQTLVQRRCNVRWHIDKSFIDHNAHRCFGQFGRAQQSGQHGRSVGVFASALQKRTHGTDTGYFAHTRTDVQGTHETIDDFGGIVDFETGAHALLGDEGVGDFRRVDLVPRPLFEQSFDAMKIDFFEVFKEKVDGDDTVVGRVVVGIVTGV